MDKMKVQTALISVSDKSRLGELAKNLQDKGIIIFSTGGTRTWLEEHDIAAQDISTYTGFPEILDGRVKTLHPKVFGGILAVKDNPHHLDQLRQNDIISFDLIVCNLYPFEKTISQASCTLETAIENIDIGGPSLIRAAAKNYKYTAVVTTPDDYAAIQAELNSSDSFLSLKTRETLALKAFIRVTAYNQAISQYLKAHQDTPMANNIDNDWSPALNLSYKLSTSLRYGENPHQAAALYTDIGSNPQDTLTLDTLQQLHGKELSYNNILDLNAGLELMAEFSDNPTIAILKHNNPCGVGIGPTPLEAFDAAFSADTISAFGGIIVCNQPIPASLAHRIHEMFFEAVIAPSFPAEALHILKQKKNIRLLQAPLAKPLANTVRYTHVQGGILVQQANSILFNDAQELKSVTQRDPSPKELQALNLSWKICKHTKSNAIVLGNANQSLGIGAGQMSRIDAAKIAFAKMHEMFGGDPKITAANNNRPLIVLASDAFFPFADVVEMAAKNNISAIIQPGGSIRDEESIAAANRHDIAMLFTFTRHFKH